MKKIYYIYSILACLFAGMLFGCTADELEKDQPRDFSKVKIEVNATLSGYEGEKPATKLTDGGSWEYDDIIYLCVGSEDNSFTLTYKGAGEWRIDSWLGGDLKNSFSASSGTLTAIYCTEGKNWRRSGGKIKGETHGDVVYTKKGKYEWVGDKLVFTINLNERVVSKLVVEDVEPGWTLVQNTDIFFGAVAEPWIALTQFLDPGWDYLYSGFDDPPCKYDSSTKKLTAWGRFGKDHNTFCIANESKTIVYVRDYLSKGLNPGQKVTIKGPFGSEASEWRKYVDGVQIKRAVVKYRTKDGSYDVLPSKFKLERKSSIWIHLFGEDGKDIEFSDSSDKAIFKVNNEKIIYTTSTYRRGIILGGNSQGSTSLNIELPSYCELENSKYEFEVTDANSANRLQLYVAKRPDASDSDYRLLNYYYDSVKKGEIRYLRIKYDGKWLLLGNRKEEFFEVSKLYDTNDAIKITPVIDLKRNLIVFYKIEVTYNNPTGNDTQAEISFKRKSNPAQIGDFFIDAVE